MFYITRNSAPAASELPVVANRLTRLIDEAFRGWPHTQEDNGSLVSAWLPPVDVLEDTDSVRIIAEVPGVRPADVRISLEGNVLTVRGEKHQVTQENTEKVHRYERSYGTFERSFTVPTTVDAEHIRAAYDNGVLTVTLPKIERAKPRQITVEVEKA